MRALWMVLAWFALGATAKAQWPEFRNREFTCTVASGNEALGTLRCTHHGAARAVPYEARVIRDGDSRWSYAGQIACTGARGDCLTGEAWLDITLARPLAARVELVCLRAMVALGASHLRCYAAE